MLTVISYLILEKENIEAKSEKETYREKQFLATLHAIVFSLGQLAIKSPNLKIIN